MTLAIVAMEERHLDSVLALDAKIALRPWSRKMFLEEMALGSFCQVLADDDGRVFGYVVARLQLDEWHLMTVGVAHGVRRRGYGADLVAGVVNHARASFSRGVLLEVRSSNNSALALYKKIGFLTLYFRENYYKAPPIAEGAVVMELRIIDKK